VTEFIKHWGREDNLAEERLVEVFMRLQKVEAKETSHLATTQGAASKAFQRDPEALIYHTG